MVAFGTRARADADKGVVLPRTEAAEVRGFILVRGGFEAAVRRDGVPLDVEGTAPADEGLTNMLRR